MDCNLFDHQVSILIDGLLTGNGTISNTQLHVYTSEILGLQRPLSMGSITTMMSGTSHQSSSPSVATNKLIPMKNQTRSTRCTHTRLSTLIEVTVQVLCAHICHSR